MQNDNSILHDNGIIRKPAGGDHTRHASDICETGALGISSGALIMDPARERAIFIPTNFQGTI